MTDMSPLERRSNLLAERLQGRIDLMAQQMRPDGRPLFHQRLSEPRALDFWNRHRYDDLGQSVLSTYTPDQIIALDQRLMQANEGGFTGGNSTP